MHLSIFKLGIFTNFLWLVLILILVFCADGEAKQDLYDVYMKNGRKLSGYQLLRSKNDPSILVAIKGNQRLEIDKESISKFESVSTKHRQRKFSYQELLKLPFQQLHDMWMRIDDSTDSRYACEIESAVNYAAKREAIKELEDATTVRSILSASDDYAKAATKQTYHLYCK